MFFLANITQFCNQNVWEYQQVSVFYLLLHAVNRQGQNSYLWEWWETNQNNFKNAKILPLSLPFHTKSGFLGQGSLESYQKRQVWTNDSKERVELLKRNWRIWLKITVLYRPCILPLSWSVTTMENFAAKIKETPKIQILCSEWLLIAAYN